MSPTAAPTPLRHADPASLEAEWGVRRIVLETTEILMESGDPVARPITQAWAAAVVHNRWIGRPTDDDLIAPPRGIAARLAKVLADGLIGALGGENHIEAFGKGALIGTAGELEHGAALTHTPYFASSLRSLLAGSAVISFADARAAAGDPVSIPLCEKTTGVRRDHYQTVRVRIPDAPRADEIVLIAAAATGPRPFPRVGDRTVDPPIDSDITNGAFS